MRHGQTVERKIVMLNLTLASWLSSGKDDRRLLICMERASDYKLVLSALQIEVLLPERNWIICELPKLTLVLGNGKVGTPPAVSAEIVRGSLRRAPYTHVMSFGSSAACMEPGVVLCPKAFLIDGTSEIEFPMFRDEELEKHLQFDRIGTEGEVRLLDGATPAVALVCKELRVPLFALRVCTTDTGEQFAVQKAAKRWGFAFSWSKKTE